MEWRRSALVAGLFLVSFLSASCGPAAERVKERQYAEVESKLRPLAIPLAKPEPGDWLAEHKEDGQTFAAYLRARPVRKSAEQGTIYICLLGDFTPEQAKILKTTQEYLEIFYQVPVKVHKNIAVKDIPERARRIHPTWGGEQRGPQAAHHVSRLFAQGLLELASRAGQLSRRVRGILRQE